MRLTFAVILLPLLATAAFGGKIDTKQLTAEQLVHMPDFMAVHFRVPKGVQVIGPVHVTWCQEKKKQGPISEIDIMKMLKVAAAKMGATALARVNIDLSGPTTDFCYATQSASGTGYVHD